jgi:tartrate-resistant acid phosphatase type 5
MTLALVLLATLASANLPQVQLTPRTTTLRLAVTGDTGEGAETVAKGIARVHAAAPVDAIVLTGDNFYPCGISSVDDARWRLARPLMAIGVPVFPVLGNHDYCGKAVPEAQIHATGTIAHWRFPAPQYSVRTPMADFAFINTTPEVRGYKLVEPAIRGAFAASHAPWRIVVGHHPVISSGYHGYFPRDEVRHMRELIPLLREEHVDLYIAGHDHHLELIRGAMLHLISGAGSSPIPPVKLHALTVFPEEIRWRERIGFAIVEITATTIRVRMYDAEGKPKSGWISGRVRHQPAGH